MVECVGHAGVRDPLAQPRRAVRLVHLNVLVGLRALPCSTTVSQPCLHSTRTQRSTLGTADGCGSSQPYKYKKNGSSPGGYAT